MTNQAKKKRRPPHPYVHSGIPIQAVGDMRFLSASGQAIAILRKQHRLQVCDAAKCKSACIHVTCTRYQEGQSLSTSHKFGGEGGGEGGGGGEGMKEFHGRGHDGYLFV